MKEQFTKLIAKLKTLDKKVWFIVGAAAVALAALVITLVLVLGGGSDAPGSDDTTATTTTAVSTTTKATTTTTTKATTTTTTTKATTTTTTVATTTTTQAPTTQATEAVATNPNGAEILGAGSQGEPYLEYPTENMTVTTVSIPAGQSLFYDIYRVGDMVLTIQDANAYVVCDGVRYDANGGVVTFTVPNALASDAVSFEIGNTGSAATSFTLSFSNRTGSYMNPVVVGNITTENKISLAEGADTGYYYKYTAAQSGKLRLYISATTDSMMLATNNRNSAQRTTEADALTDAKGTYIELEVQAGDEILINVGAIPNKRGKYPATDITWFGVFA